MKRDYSEYIGKFVKIVIKYNSENTCVFGKIINVDSENVIFKRTTNQEMIIPKEMIVYMI